MLKTYKYRIYPTLEQQNQMTNIFGCVRFVYNLGLETKMSAYIANKTNLSCFDLSNQLTQLKKNEATWLKECPSQALQDTLANLDNAYTRFFKGAGFPKFKNKNAKQAFSLPQGVKVEFEKHKVFIPKLKWMNCVFDRNFTGIIKTCTISKTKTNKYFICILVDTQKEIPSKPNIAESTSVGIDLGIKDLAILSDGTKFENPKWYQNAQKQLRVEQRTLSRRHKKNIKYEEQSKRFFKQKLVVAKLYEKIKNQRINYLQKVTTSIIKKYDTIILEDLDVNSMLQNNSSSMSKAIQDVSWYEFRRQLTYKSEWYGKNLLFIGQFDPSSKTCSCCGTIKRDLTLSDREWTCNSCKTTHDRDVNAATNIKTFGLRNHLKDGLHSSDAKELFNSLSETKHFVS